MALDWLPGDDWNALKPLGLHLQASLLDLGQFLTVSDATLADPSAATPFYFGAQVGFLLGTPKYNVLVAADGGYAPGMQYAKTVDVGGSNGPAKVLEGGWRLGGSIGMYVPFIDFN